MTTDSALAITAAGLGMASLAIARSLVRFSARLDRRRPPPGPRPVEGAVAYGMPLPDGLAAAFAGGRPVDWPRKTAILLLGHGCSPCDEVRRELAALLRAFGEFGFFVGGAGVPELPAAANLHPLDGTLAMKALGLSVTPALVVAIAGRVDTLAIVNAGGQIEAALVAASRRAGGGR